MVRVLSQLMSPRTDSMTSTDKRNIHLIFANKTRKDIIWLEDIDHLAKTNDGYVR